MNLYKLTFALLIVSQALAAAVGRLCVEFDYTAKTQTLSFEQEILEDLSVETQAQKVFQWNDALHNCRIQVELDECTFFAVLNIKPKWLTGEQGDKFDTLQNTYGKVCGNCTTHGIAGLPQFSEAKVIYIENPNKGAEQVFNCFIRVRTSSIGGYTDFD